MTSRRSLVPALFVGPGLVLFVVFVLWPALHAVLISLYSWNGFSPRSVYVGAENYTSLLTDRRFAIAARNTLYFVGVGGIAHFAFAFLFATLLHHPRFAAKRLFQTLLVFPAFVSIVGVATLWERLYDPREGLLDAILRGLGVDEVIWLSTDHAMRSVVGAAVWAGVGTHMILLLAGLRRIPASFGNAARMDGATELQVFWSVTLPMLRRVTYTALALWTIGAMQIFGLVQGLAGQRVPNQLETISTYQYAISFNARDNIYLMGRGSAMAVVLVLMILAAIAILRLVFGGREVEY